MTVRAKFRCVAKSPAIGADAPGVNVTFQPVTSGSAENDAFYLLTPGGSVHLSLLRPETADLFAVGAAYYLDFNPEGIAP